MLHSSLGFITHELNEYLKLRTGTSDSDEDKIFLTNVATDEGVQIPDNSLGLSLINIEEERVFKDQKAARLNSDGSVNRLNPEIKLNLYILITAYFQGDNSNSAADYSEGLKQLSYAISFFQAKNVFTAANSPSMGDFDPDIRKLIVELFSYNFEQLYNFWSVVGTNYLPSVLYKVRLVRFQENAVADSNVPIEKIGIETKGR
jgi:hypothetical protein